MFCIAGRSLMKPKCESASARCLGFEPTVPQPSHLKTPTLSFAEPRFVTKKFHRTMFRFISLMTRQIELLDAGVRTHLGIYMRYLDISILKLGNVVFFFFKFITLQHIFRPRIFNDSSTKMV